MVIECKMDMQNPKVWNHSAQLDTTELTEVLCGMTLCHNVREWNSHKIA